jgi:putative polyhydroxyalkanoate system protein
MADVREGIDKLGQSLQAEHGLLYTWQSADRVEFKHKMAKGFLVIESEQLVLELKLSMFYAAMAPIVKKRIVELADEFVK